MTAAERALLKEAPGGRPFLSLPSARALAYSFASPRAKMLATKFKTSVEQISQ